MKTDSPLKFFTTGIGSLPHQHYDAALQHSLEYDVPFLPQIPIRNPWEYMIPQALDGLPGLQVKSDGSTSLSLKHWLLRSPEFERRLNLELNKNLSDLTKDTECLFNSFEPTSSTCSCWLPFLWELKERKIKTAKIQICGPITAQKALVIESDIESGTTSSTPAPHNLQGLHTQINKLITLRAQSMCLRLLSMNVHPILFIDEPALLELGQLGNNTAHRQIIVQELRLFIQTLKKLPVTIGIHCCSNTHWSALLDLPIDMLSIDTQHSLQYLLSNTPSQSIQSFINRGGRFAFGVVPTSESSELSHSHLYEFLKHKDLSSFLLQGSALTPACGLALQSIQRAETVLNELKEIKHSLLNNRMFHL